MDKPRFVCDLCFFGKSGWGFVKIAIPNNLAQRLLSEKDMNGGLLLFDKAEFAAIEKGE